MIRKQKEKNLWNGWSIDLNINYHEQPEAKAESQTYITTCELK